MRRILKRTQPSLVAIAALSVLLAACAKSTSPSGGGGGLVVDAKSVNGVGTVLVSTSGLTLYHLTTETNGTISCTGSCASTWPPFTLPAGQSSATGGSGVGGTFGTIKRPDGTVQVTYNGMPLYTYSGDTGPGQANGQGIQGVWYAVTSAAGGASSTPSQSHGYGGGGY